MEGENGADLKHLPFGDYAYCEAGMAQPLRLGFEDATYYLSASGNAPEAIFHDGHNRVRFIALFSE
jgi:hypothetical protein